MMKTEMEKEKLQVRMVAMYCMSVSHTVDRVSFRGPHLESTSLSPCIDPCLFCLHHNDQL